MSARQRALAGDVARAWAVPGRCPWWFLAVARLCAVRRHMLRAEAGGSCGEGLVIRWTARSGDLRGGDGDDAAGVEFLELPHQVILPGIGGFAAGVEVGAQVGVWLAGLQDAVGDLEQGVGDRGDRPLLRALVPRAAELADQAAEPGLQPAGYPDCGPGGRMSSGLM